MISCSQQIVDALHDAWLPPQSFTVAFVESVYGGREVRLRNVVTRDSDRHGIHVGEVFRQPLKIEYTNHWENVLWFTCNTQNWALNGWIQSYSEEYHRIVSIVETFPISSNMIPVSGSSDRVSLSR